HCGSIDAEFEISAGEFLERPLILEKDDLAERLAARLQADAELRDGGVAHVLAFSVDAALTVRAAYAKARFADGREDGIAVGGFEEFAAFAGFIENLDGLLVFVRRHRRK